MRKVKCNSYNRSLNAIIGLSGCGKTTLLRRLCGVSRWSEGRVRIMGMPVKRLLEEYPLAIGYLAQGECLAPGLSVHETLWTAARLRLPRSVDLDVVGRWIAHLLRISRMEPLLEQRVETLSGGEKRRLALAEALVSDPSVLFLDELTSGLDAYSDREMMRFLRELAHEHGKTVLLVTHSTLHLELADAILVVHEGRVLFHGSHGALLRHFDVRDVTDLFELLALGGGAEGAPGTDAVGWRIGGPEGVAMVSGEEGAATSRDEVDPGEAEEGAEDVLVLKTAQPPSGWCQFPVLMRRQWRLFFRDRGQVVLQGSLAVTFPLLVAVFALGGLPEVRRLVLDLEPNVVRSLHEQLLYLQESFQAAATVSGLAMFQVVLLALSGANNGAREIAREREVQAKELRAGLSPWAYVGSKFGFVMVLCVVQALWMTWFVKTLCGFPGSFGGQFAILFGTTLAVSCACLAISAASKTPERASLLAIYLVGFQLPLSGAALALPEWLAWVCRPFIAAYWGWSGYLETFSHTRHFQIVAESTHTVIARYDMSLAVLFLHVGASLALAAWWTSRIRFDGGFR